MGGMCGTSARLCSAAQVLANKGSKDVQLCRDTVTSNSLTSLTLVLGASTTEVEGENSHWLYKKGLQMGLGWLDEESLHML
jgi:hypothetical protein